MRMIYPLSRWERALLGLVMGIGLTMAAAVFAGLFELARAAGNVNPATAATPVAGVQLGTAPKTVPLSVCAYQWVYCMTGPKSPRGITYNLATGETCYQYMWDLGTCAQRDMDENGPDGDVDLRDFAWGTQFKFYEANLPR